VLVSKVTEPEIQLPWAPILAAASVAAVAIFTLPGAAGEYRLAKWALAGALVVVLAGIRFVAHLSRPIDVALIDWRLGAVAALTTFAAIAAPLASTPYALAHAGGTLRWVLGLAFALLTALSLAAGGRSARRLSASILTGTAAVCALLVVLQAAAVYPFAHLIDVDPELRAAGTFGNPNWAAAFLLAALPSCLALRRDIASRRGSAWLLALATLIGFAVVATRSKGGILALAAGVGIFKLLEPGIRTRIRRGMVAAAAVAATGVLTIAVAGHLSAVSWIRGRLFLWTAALPMIGDRPWTGIGLGGFPAAYPLAAARIIAGDASAFMPLNTIEFLYNEPLQVAVESGLPAAALLVIFVALSIRTAFQHRDNLSRGVGSGLAALSLYSLVDAPFQIPATAMLFWFMLGWIMAGSDRDQDEERNAVRMRRARVPVAAAALLMIGAVGGLQSVRHFAGNALWTRGARAMHVGDHRQAVDHLRAAAWYLPESGHVHVLLGRALAANGQTEAALSEFDTALRLQFDFDTTFYRLEMLEQIRGPSGVLHEWEALSRTFPLLVSPNYHIGRIRWQEGDLDGAAAAFRRILATRQDTTLAAMFRHEARTMLHRIEEAGPTR
jgi:O-antigen ligase